MKVGYTANGFFQQRIKLIENDLSAFAETLYQDTAAQLINKGNDVHDLTRKRLHAIGSGGGYINASQAMMRLHDEPITALLDKIQCRVDVIGGRSRRFLSA